MDPLDPILRRKARRLSAEEIRSDQTHQLVGEMLDFAYGKSVSSNGARLVGLAAPQVGVDAAIVLVDRAQSDAWSGNLQVLINPSIVRLEGEPQRYCHGCFSADPFMGYIELPTGRMDVTALDTDGNEQLLTFTGRNPVHVAWHEIEHLEGRRFPDKTLEQGGVLYRVWPQDWPALRQHLAQHGSIEGWPHICNPMAWLAMREGMPYDHLL